MSDTGCPTGLVYGLQIDLEESIDHVEPKKLIHMNYERGPWMAKVLNRLRPSRKFLKKFKIIFF
jgi:hypothetical protein